MLLIQFVQLWNEEIEVGGNLKNIFLKTEPSPSDSPIFDHKLSGIGIYAGNCHTMHNSIPIPPTIRYSPVSGDHLIIYTAGVQNGVHIIRNMINLPATWIVSVVKWLEVFLVTDGDFISHIL